MDLEFKHDYLHEKYFDRLIGFEVLWYYFILDGLHGDRFIGHEYVCACVGVGVCMCVCLCVCVCVVMSVNHRLPKVFVYFTHLNEAANMGNLFKHYGYIGGSVLQPLIGAHTHTQTQRHTHTQTQRRAYTHKDMHTHTHLCNLRLHFHKAGLFDEASRSVRLPQLFQQPLEISSTGGVYC